MRIRWLSLLLIAASTFAQAQGTRLWQQSSFASFEKGTPNGVAIRSDGVLEASPTPEKILTSASPVLWSIATDKHGNVYLGTGSPATVLKVSPDGKSTTLFESSDLSVQVVRMGPDGMLYVATLPNGKVYRIDPNAPLHKNSSVQQGDSNATVVFNPSRVSPKPTYIWDLAFDASGRLYIATGEPAAIYRVDPKHLNAPPGKFFTSNEQHLRCLLFAGNGDLYAGSAGRGLIYRISPNGKGFVLFEAPKREISAMALDPAGNLYVAAVGDKGPSGLPPLDVHNKPTLTATIRIVTMGPGGSSSSNTLVPGGTTIYQIAPDGAPRELWSSTNDVVYTLAWQPGTNGGTGGLLAGSGNDGHLYRIAPDRTFADLAHFEARQVMGLALTPTALYVATSNLGRLYRMQTGVVGKGGPSTYLSTVHDAQFFSDWGKATVRGSGQYDVFARVGNIEQPAEGWSAWQNVTPGTSAEPLPKGRFLQWKATLRPGAQLDEVGFFYLPQNVAPVVDSVFVELHARAIPTAGADAQPSTFSIEIPSDMTDGVADRNAKTSSQSATASPTAIGAPDWATVAWKAHDPNGDRLSYSVYARGDGEANWFPLQKNLRQTYASLNLTNIPDGGYTLRVIASDAPSHPIGKALTGYKDSGHFLIDTTPPVVSALRATLTGHTVHVTFDATTKLSTIARASYSVDAGPWQYVEPVGQLSDSTEEHYDFTVPLPVPANHSDDSTPTSVRTTAPQQHIVAIRVADRAGNVTTRKTIVE